MDKIGEDERVLGGLFIVEGFFQRGSKVEEIVRVSYSFSIGWLYFYFFVRGGEVSSGFQMFAIDNNKINDIFYFLQFDIVLGYCFKYYLCFK